MSRPVIGQPELEWTWTKIIKKDSDGELTDVTPTASPRADEAVLGLTREVTIIESNEFKDDDDALEQAAKDAEIELEKEEIQDIRVRYASYGVWYKR